MRSGVLHCRCSKCFSLPSKRRLRKRPRLVTLLSLPEDVLLYIIKCLPAEDILSVRVVHSHFKSLVDTHTSVWACACFQDAWPSPDNLRLFERAAECGNFEAAVKLGIAYLYNEGLSVSDEGRAEVNGLKASHFFSLTERLNASSNPFIWLFIRPPWSVNGSCCKAVVYESLKEECQSQTVQKGSVLYCLAKVLSLFEDEEKKVAAQKMFEESSKQGCLTSSYFLWKRHRKTAMSDPGRYLQSLRKLRDYAAKGCWEAQLSLAKACGNGNQLGLEPRACNELVAQVFQASHPVNKASIFTVQKGMNDTMRYILVDWLVEVATMKDFSSLCLHMTVGCVDRYLKLRSVPRARLQLVGIACMVICTRFISKEILTIREAVWLTDNTYKYEDLVRMMGEIISALEGKIRTPTLVDYKDVLSNIAPLERKTLHLCSYICELSLLYTDLSMYSPALLATAALLLAKLLHRQAHPWPSQLAECTGFTLEELTPCVLSIHKKCFHDDAPKDYRQVSLTAVKQRFEDDCYDEISKEKVKDHSQLCALLGVKPEEPEASPPLTTAVEVQAFLCSPSGNKTKRRRADSINEDRGSFVTTPTAELISQEDTLLGNFLDWSLDSSCTGYEGDRESEGEKEGDVTGPSGILDITVVHVDPDQHCCEDSSDEDDLEQDLQCVPPPEQCIESNAGLKPFLTFNSPKQSSDQASSGYSSVNSSNPNSSLESNCTTPTTTTSATLSQWVSGKVWPFLTQYLKPHSHPVPLSSAEDSGYRRQVKRKNIAGHSEEDKKIGILSL